MRILICGMYRSGSTLLYNMVRLASMKAGHSVWAGSFENYKKDNGAEIEIVKIHHYDDGWQKWANWRYASHRNLIAVAMSAVEFGLIPNDKGKILDWLAAQVEAYKKYSESAEWCERRFEYFKNFEPPCLTLIKIGCTFGLNRDQLLKVSRELKLIQPPSGMLTYGGLLSTFNPITLMHYNHISTGNQKLKGDIANAINERLKDFQLSHGYLR